MQVLITKGQERKQRNPSFSKLLSISLILFCTQLIALVVLADAQCRESRSEGGVALLHATYHYKFAKIFSNFVNECLNDPLCMSINFWWYTKKCDLNNKRKERSCSACLVTEPYSTYMGMVKPLENQGHAKSCTALTRLDPTSRSGDYIIDPDGNGGLAPFEVTCNMTEKNGVGVTIISHDSESRTHVQGCERGGCYSRDINYTGASLSQLAILTSISSHCEQFIKYECLGSVIFRRKNVGGWWVSRDSKKMTHWGGASGNDKCACGMTNSCADPSYGCNCDKNDMVWREDSGLLTDKTKLPVKQLRFGDTGDTGEQGYHTLGKFKCYGTA
ncbi:contactin-associated protein-like 2 [Montipora capricornis]|uniref:contactin-associated protein-like 2 n=1 Tax=Montipora capricornis TaxID=246305 RepID=UPI0035F161BA